MVPAVLGDPGEPVDVESEPERDEREDFLPDGTDVAEVCLHRVAVVRVRPRHRAVARPAPPHPEVVERDIGTDGEQFGIVGLPGGRFFSGHDIPAVGEITDKCLLLQA